MSGLFLILIGFTKLVVVKACTHSGWKGGEFFPIMFASAAIGLGLSNLIPGLHPMVAIAALMGACLTIVMDKIFIAIVISLIFLPNNLFFVLLFSSLTALAISKKIIINSETTVESSPAN